MKKTILFFESNLNKTRIHIKKNVDRKQEAFPFYLHK